MYLIYISKAFKPIIIKLNTRYIQVNELYGAFFHILKNYGYKVSMCKIYIVFMISPIDYHINLPL